MNGKNDKACTHCCSHAECKRGPEGTFVCASCGVDLLQLSCYGCGKTAPTGDRMKYRRIADEIGEVKPVCDYCADMLVLTRMTVNDLRKENDVDGVQD